MQFSSADKGVRNIMQDSLAGKTWRGKHDLNTLSTQSSTSSVQLCMSLIVHRFATEVHPTDSTKLPGRSPAHDMAKCFHHPLMMIWNIAVQGVMKSTKGDIRRCTGVTLGLMPAEGRGALACDMAAAVFAEILLPPHLARVPLLDGGMLQHREVNNVLEEPSIPHSQLNSAILGLHLPALLEHPYWLWMTPLHGI